MFSTFRITALAALVSLLPFGAASAGPILEFSTGNEIVSAAFDTTLGWSFTTQQAITVTALDAFDPTGDGNAGQVRLYNAGGTVLASVTVTTSDPKEGTPISFYSAAITPVLLAANTTYFIAEDFGTTTHGFVQVSGLTSGSAITYDHVVSAAFQGQNPTTDFFGGVLNPGIFGPNFDIAAAVPEPASLTLLAVGLAGLGMVLRLRRA
jgi:hypothetical protein